MSILSVEFLVFLAALVLLYYLLPLKIRKWLPLTASAVFWLLGGLFGAAYLAVESALVWGAALGIEKLKKRESNGKLILIPVLILMFAGMMALKEHTRIESFLLSQELEINLNPVWPVTAPLGISYFTFQGAGYLIEVNRGKVRAEKNYLKVLLFCGFFPQLGQGPISMWKDLFPQLDTPHRLEPQAFVEAVFRMAWGFFKKLAIADRVASFVGPMIAHSEELPGWLALLTILAYTIELYADFSGGIDIVRGAAGLIGIRLAENFRQPFFARTVSDYWRRWHISLGAWFRTYVLYPLAVSRPGIWIGKIGKKLFDPKVGRALPGALATLIVFILIGLWHAFHWNALLYGLWFGLLSMGAILLEPLFKGWKKKLRITGKTKWFQAWSLLRTWLLVLFAQFFACTASPAQAFGMMKNIFTNFAGSTIGDFSKVTFYTFDSAEWIFAGAALVILLTVDILNEHVKDFPQKAAGSKLILRWPLLMLLMLSVLIFGRYGVGYDASAFVYAGF